MTDATHGARAREIIAGLGLKYRAAFVPKSAAKDSPEMSKYPRLHWMITIEREHRAAVTIKTPYSEGIGRIESEMRKTGYMLTSRGGKTLHDLYCEREVSEHGRIPRRDGSMLGIPIAAPDVVDVLYCLVQDSDAIECASFEDWAGCFGYDTDSRAAERTFNACRDIGLRLRLLIGDAKLTALRDAFIDY